MRARKKIPDNAKLVFKGDRWSVYRWKLKMYDGSIGTFEGVRGNDGSRVLAFTKDSLLITEEQQPHKKEKYFIIPGGAIDGKESHFATAKRELLEETGYSAKSWKSFKTINQFGNEMIEEYTYLYIATGCKRVAKQKLDAGEKIKVIEVKLKHLNKFLDSHGKKMHPLLVELLKTVLKDPKIASALKKK